MAIDFTKTPADKRVTVALGPTGTATGVQEVAAPTADELNNASGSGMQPASQSISWNDFDYGVQASETLNEPSLADAATYEEFGQNNFGGAMSFYYPAEYDDDSNMHSVIYDLTDQPGAKIDVAVRIDGDVETSVPFTDGDFVSVYRTRGDSEANPFTPGESKRRTVGFNQAGEFAYYTVVGDPTITLIEPATYDTGTAGRIRASIGGRDVTNSLTFTTSDSDVINVYGGGFYEALTAGTATLTVTDPRTGESVTSEVTVADAGGTP